MLCVLPANCVEMMCERGAKAGAGAGEHGKEHEEQEEQEEHAVPTSAGCIWARGRASVMRVLPMGGAGVALPRGAVLQIPLGIFPQMPAGFPIDRAPRLELEIP